MKTLKFLFLLVVSFSVKSQVHDDLYGKLVEKKEKSIFKSSLNGDKFISGYEKFEKYNDDTYIIYNPVNYVATKRKLQKYRRGATFGIIWATTIMGGVGYVIDSDGFSNKPTNSFLWTKVFAGAMSSYLISFIIKRKKNLYENASLNEIWLKQINKNFNIESPTIRFSDNGCINSVVIEPQLNSFEKEFKQLSSNSNNRIKLYDPIEKKFNYGIWSGKIDNNLTIGKGRLYFENGRLFEGQIDFNNYPIGDCKVYGNYKNQFNFLQSNFVNGIPNGVTLVSSNFDEWKTATFINDKAEGKSIWTKCGESEEMNCKNGNCESAFLEKLREQKRNEIFAAIIAGAIVYKMGSWMLGNVSKSVSEHNSNIDLCDSSWEVDETCDGSECYYFTCHSSGKFIRIEQLSNNNYKVGAGSNVKYATNINQAREFAEKMTTCFCK